ncbi:hypothetical protein SMICM17S_10581 [Streptomyces microflavus]
MMFSGFSMRPKWAYQRTHRWGGPQHHAAGQQSERAPPFAPAEQRERRVHGRRGVGGASQPGGDEPAEHHQRQRRAAVLRELVEREAADGPVEERQQLRAPPAVMGERVPHHMRGGTQCGGPHEPQPGGRPERFAGPPLSPYEGVDAAPYPYRKQCNQRLAQRRPHGHQHGRDQHVHGDHTEEGVREVTELHGPGDHRVREVGDVGRERAGDERRGEQPPAGGPVPADRREHGGGMAEGERHGGKYARTSGTAPGAPSVALPDHVCAGT